MIKLFPKWSLGFIRTLVLVLVCFNLNAQAPDWDSVYIDYLNKYQPVDTPAWIFPLCFKNFLGEWDTVYIGHDSKATWANQELLFGVSKTTVDTSIFSAYFLCIAGNMDSCYQYIPWDFEYLPSTGNGIDIKFTKGRMPLTVYWDNSLFYSDSIPYPDIDPLPRAKGTLWCNDGSPQYNNCPFGVPNILSDSSYSELPSPYFHTDSMYFDGNGTSDQLITISVFILPFNTSTASVDQKNDNPLFDFHPNPAGDYIIIESRSPKLYDIALYDLLGKIQYFEKDNVNKKSKIDLRSLPTGVYFIKISTKESLIIQKIIHL